MWIHIITASSPACSFWLSFAASAVEMKLNRYSLLFINAQEQSLQMRQPAWKFFRELFLLNFNFSSLEGVSTIYGEFTYLNGCVSDSAQIMQKCITDKLCGAVLPFQISDSRPINNGVKNVLISTILWPYPRPIPIILVIFVIIVE